MTEAPNIYQPAGAAKVGSVLPITAPDGVLGGVLGLLILEAISLAFDIAFWIVWSVVSQAPTSGDTFYWVNIISMAVGLPLVIATWVLLARIARAPEARTLAWGCVLLSVVGFGFDFLWFAVGQVAPSVHHWELLQLVKRLFRALCSSGAAVFFLLAIRKAGRALGVRVLDLLIASAVMVVVIRFGQSVVQSVMFYMERFHGALISTQGARSTLGMVLNLGGGALVLAVVVHIYVGAKRRAGVTR